MEQTEDEEERYVFVNQSDNEEKQINSLEDQLNLNNEVKISIITIYNLLMYIRTSIWNYNNITYSSIKVLNKYIYFWKGEMMEKKSLKNFLFKMKSIEILM